MRIPKSQIRLPRHQKRWSLGVWTPMVQPVILMSFWGGICSIVWIFLDLKVKSLDVRSIYLFYLLSEKNSLGVTLPQSFMAVNSLMMLYFWTTFRGFRKRLSEPWWFNYLYFVGAVLMLFYLQLAIITFVERPTFEQVIPFVLSDSPPPLP